MPSPTYRLALTAQEVEQLLAKIPLMISSDIIRTSLANADDSTIPTTKAVQNALDVISGDFSSLGDLAFDDTIDLTSNKATNVLPITKGGTGSNTVEGAQLNLGILTEADVQALIDESIPTIQSVDLSSNQAIGILPVSKGGTGANTSGQARTNLGVYSIAETRSLFTTVQLTLTDAAITKLAAATVSAPVTVSEMAVSDTLGTIVSSRTALSNEVWRGNLSNTILTDTNDDLLKYFEAFIPTNTAAFTTLEVGLFDTEGTLFAIGSIQNFNKTATTSLKIQAVVPFTSSAQTDVFVKQEIKMKHSELDELNAVGAHDQIYRRKTTVAEIESGVFSVGDRLEVTDRNNASFDVISGGTSDGYSVLDAGNGNTAVLSERNTKRSVIATGAVGDGVTSDSAAIAAANISGGNTVELVSNFTYAIDSSISLERFSSLTSDDLQSFSLATVKWIGATSGTMLQEESNQTIEGVSFDGDSKSGVKGFYVGNSTKFTAYSTLRRTRAENLDIGYYVDNCFDTNLEQIRSANNRIGIHINPAAFTGDGGYVTTFRIKRAYVTGNTQQGLRDSSSVKAKVLSVEDSVFELNGDATYPQIDLAENQAGVLAKLYVEDGTQTTTAIKMQSGALRDSYINGFAVGVDLGSGSSNIIMDNVKFASGAGASVQSSGGANASYAGFRKVEFSGAPSLQTVCVVYDGCSGDMPSGIPAYSHVVTGTVPKSGVGTTPAITRNIEAWLVSNAGTTVDANSQYRFNGTITASRITDGNSVLSVTPQTQLPTGLMATVERNTDTTARIVISNVTTASVVLPANTYVVRVEQFYQMNS